MPAEVAVGGAVPPPTRRWLDRPVVFLVALLLAWGIVAGNGWPRLRFIQMVTASGVEGQDPPELEAASPTGYADGVRRVISPRGVDGCHWIMQAQRMAHEGLWRVRTVPGDNFPQGRETNWSQPLLWWLVGLGQVEAWRTGRPLGAAIEDAAQWAPALLHALLLLALPLAIRRVFGWLAAGLLALGMAAVYTFASQFFVGTPDHHGLAATAVLALALGLAAGGGGWVAPGASGPARRWFGASGLATAVALWISAAAAVPVLLGLGGGVGLAALLFVRPGTGDGPVYEPGLWRLWGATAAGASLFFYLVEYFPAHLGMRLEVNHPLYAVALLGAGELLFRLTRQRSGGGPPVQGRGEGLRLLAALVAVFAVPVVIGAAGQRVFLLRDPFLWALHRDYIHEFSSFNGWLRLQSTEALAVFLSPLPLLGLAVLRLLLSREISRVWKTMLVIPATAALAVTVLSFLQVRWMSSADTLWLATLAVVTAGVTQAAHRPLFRWWEKALAALFVVVLCGQMPQRIIRDALAGWAQPPAITEEETVLLFARDVAYRLRALGGDEIPVVASGPTSTTWLMYYGGLHGLGTLYWDNVAGLKTAARLYAARDDAEALSLIRAHGVGFVALLSFEPFIAEYPALIRGLPAGSSPADTLAARLAGGREVPAWARALPVRVPGGPRTDWAAIYDVRAALR